LDRHTSKGDGVQREIRIAREAKVPEVLILEKGVPIPEEFKDTGDEYKRLDLSSPNEAFAVVFQALRKIPS